jgi:signal transduction histidine kinase
MTVMDKLMYPEGELFTYLLPLNLLQNSIWGLLGLVVLYLARRFPIEDVSSRAWRAWMLHGAASLVVTAVGLLLIYLANFPFMEEKGRAEFLAHFAKGVLRFFRNYFQMSLFTMWGVLAAFHVVRAHRLMRERELEATQLESRLAQAQNQALRMQLQPHFLFNTLNSISALIHSDGEAADQMLTRLADLLRMTLDGGSTQEVPLRQELAFCEGYLAIEHIRFQDRLKVRFEIPPDCMEARVPSFLLQPLVENAIKHGVSGLARASTIEVRARRDGEWLELEVKDDGKGFEKGREGIGTTNTTHRLRLLYKERQKFTLLSEPGNGTTALIRIPWSVEA